MSLPSLMKLVSRASGLLTFSSDGMEAPGQVNSRGDIIVVQSMPERAELVRMGQSYQAQLASHVAPLAAIPTTTAGITLYNAEPAGGKTYLIEAGFCWCDTSVAATTVATLVGMVNSTKQSNAQTGSIAKTSLNGKPNYGGKGTVTAGATVTNEGWFPIASSAPSSGTTTVGLAVYAPCEGLFQVQPGGAFSLHVMAEAAAGDFFIGLIWHEVQLVQN